MGEEEEEEEEISMLNIRMSRTQWTVTGPLFDLLDLLVHTCLLLTSISQTPTHETQVGWHAGLGLFLVVSLDLLRSSLGDTMCELQSYNYLRPLSYVFGRRQP